MISDEDVNKCPYTASLSVRQRKSANLLVCPAATSAASATYEINSNGPNLDRSSRNAVKHNMLNNNMHRLI